MAQVNAMVKGMDAMALYKEGMSRAKEWFSNNRKMNNDAIAVIASECGITFEDAKGLYKQVCEEKRIARKMEAFRRFFVYYKGSGFSQKVEYLTDKNVLVFRGLDKNAIYYAYDKAGALCFNAITTSSEKSARNKWDNALVSGNKKKVIALLTEASCGLSFSDLAGEMRTRSNYSEREARGQEKRI